LKACLELEGQGHIPGAVLGHQKPAEGLATETPSRTCLSLLLSAAVAARSLRRRRLALHLASLWASSRWIRISN
jgi:hypothetical protein